MQAGTTYSGFFSQVAGAGSTSVWHLMVNNFYFGRMRYADGWFFDSNCGMEYLADFFGDYVMAWHQRFFT